jgi:hypothetical protein
MMRFDCEITVSDPDNPSGVDEYGNPIPGTSVVATICHYEQQSSDEARDPSGEVLQDLTLLMVPSGTPINGWSMVTIAGVAFDVIGRPNVVMSPRTRLASHVEASLEMSE